MVKRIAVLLVVLMLCVPVAAGAAGPVLERTEFQEYGFAVALPINWSFVDMHKFVELSGEELEGDAENMPDLYYMFMDESMSRWLQVMCWDSSYDEASLDELMKNDYGGGTWVEQDGRRMLVISDNASDTGGSYIVGDKVIVCILGGPISDSDYVNTISSILASVEFTR